MADRSLLLEVVTTLLLLPFVTAGADSPLTFNFDADSVGGPPKGFEFGRTGGGMPGKWVEVRGKFRAR